MGNDDDLSGGERKVKFVDVAKALEENEN